MSSKNQHALICDALAGMLPATEEEIAEVTGLDDDTVATCLEELGRRSQVMFNPLTKRFSLPKAALLPGIAA